MKLKESDLQTLENLFVVEYSVLQNNFYIESFLEILKKNRRNIGNEIASDYVPIGITRTREQAYKLVKQTQSKLDKARKGKRFKANWHSVAQILLQLNPLSLKQTTSEPSQK